MWAGLTVTFHPHHLDSVVDKLSLLHKNAVHQIIFNFRGQKNNTQKLNMWSVLTKMSVLKISPPAIPISSLEPVVLVEGQSYRKAALCRSVARPPPRLSWDTDLNGQSINRSSENGVVTSHYSLHPLRAMNGKKLDCLVWHPTSPTPRRLRNKLEVHCEY